MAIVKSGSRQSRAYNSSNNHRNHVGASNLPLRKSSGVSRLCSEGTGNDDGSFFFDSSSDSSDSEPVSSSRASSSSGDCQICQVGDKVCELPIELFDIPDLSQILSLDTWNSELSEEERESLLAFLPAMDEDTFRSTLRELLSGGSFNFGSPMSDLMQMLRSGECHPQVASMKETLICLQRKEHYHRIRRHHNQMVNNCVEMQHLWQDYPDCSISERVELWKDWKHDRIRPTLDSRYEKNNSGPFKSLRLQSLLNRKANFLRGKESAMNSHIFDTPSPPPPPPPEVAEPTTNKAKRKNKKDAKSKKAGPKGVLKLLPKASNNNSKMESFRSQSPFDQMQAVTCSPYNEVDNSFEDVLIPSPPGMYEPVVTLAMDRSGSSPINEKTSFKVKAENKIKGSGDKNVKGLYGNDRKDKNIGYSRRSKKGNVVVHNVLNEELDPSPLIDEEDLDFSPIDGEPINAESPSFDGQLKRNKSENHSPVENDDTSLFMGGDINEDIYLAEKEMQDILDDKDEVDTEEKPVKRRRKRPKASDDYSLPPSCSLNGEAPLGENTISSRSSKKAALPVPPVVESLPFSVIHLLSAVRLAMINTSNESDYLLNPEENYLQSNGPSFSSGTVGKEQDEKRPALPAVPLQEIVKRVQDNPGDPKILEAKEPLQGLVKGVLKVLSSKATQPGMKGWKPLVAYNKAVRGWSWIGPVPDSHIISDGNEVQISHEVWSVPQKILYKLQELFGNWLKHEQEILQQLGQLSLLPVPASPVILDEKERFRELRAQKSLITISPTSEEMRAYFRMEESLRYSVPDRAFCYTTLDGRKSAVAPLRRIGGKPNSKARDHFMLKPDRPPHVTILCLVRDAAARLPGSIGTRADVCSLIRDSQYIVEDVSDAQLNQVVSGALDRLHYERDPCVRFDGDRKLWVYLHTDKEDEDFEDDATSSTKRWKRTKKEGNENPDFSLAPDYDYTSTRDDQDSCGLGIDFSPSSCFGGANDLSSVYSSSGRGDLIFTHSAGSLPSPNVLDSAFPGQGREDAVLPFIDLPPSIQPPCVNMQQSHPMGWEVLSNRWDQDPPFQSTDHIVGEDYNSVVSLTPSNRESEVMIDGSS